MLDSDPEWDRRRRARTLALRGTAVLQLALLLGFAPHCQAGDDRYVFGSDAGTGSGAAGAGGAATNGGMSATLGAAAGAPPASTGSAGAAPLAGGRGVGAACTDDSGCDAGNCVDRVCCEGACGGCDACAAELTGKSNGICAPVLAGQDPHSTCEDETPTNECGLDGSCNGAGACRRAGKGHLCVAATCFDNTFTPAAICDGEGACMAGTPEPCGMYPCEPSGCARTCSLDADCGESSYCKTATGTCAAKAPNGTPASAAFECSSGIVADGVCCDTPCAGCRACSGAPLTSGLAGQCLDVVAGEDPHEACTDSGALCGADGACDGAGACRTTPREGEACSPDPSDRCVTGGTCRSGACQGAAATVCPMPAGQCRVRGTCDPATGSCSQAVAEDDAVCDDSDPCTDDDRCTDGLCAGTAKVCNSPPACKAATTCSAGQCTYAQNVTDGLRDEKCPSATPFCFYGSCTKCRTNSDCSGSTPHCHPVAHDCVCRLPSSGNLLANPGFDDWQVDAPRDWGWYGTTEGVASVPDSESCDGSRGARWATGGPAQCVNVTGSKSYFLGGKFKDGVSGNVVEVTYYPGADCGGDLSSFVKFDITPQTSWKAQSWQLTTPATAKSALLGVLGETQSADQLFFNPDGAQF
jgi:hypothetical protein